jgi:ribosome-associated protein
MLTVNSSVVIPEEDMSESFIRSSGPGGQHVNKTATAVQLRYDASRADFLSLAAKARLRRLAGSRMNADGVLLIEASSYRSQERNRQEARQRLAALLRRALEKPRPRQRTRPTAASVRNRLEVKKRRSMLKRQRSALARGDRLD